MNIVKDGEFEEALNSEDNIKILNHVCKKYIGRINTEELHRCKLMALWEAIRNFDPKRKVKFTSFLYSCMDWECKRQLSIYKKERKFSTNFLVEDGRIDSDDYEVIDWIDSLPEKLAVAVKQKFVEGYTIQEIAQKNSYSRETARQYVQKGVERLKNKYG